MKGNKLFTGRGNDNIEIDNPLSRGKWKLQVRSDNGNVVANISLTNGKTHARRFNLPSSGQAFPAYSYFHIDHDCPSAFLKVSASPTTDWEVTLSLISETSPVNANNQIEEKEAMQKQTPEYVCVNINDPVNVRSGPGYAKYPKVAGGDRDIGGGVVPGTRYKVVRTETNGELVSGNSIWHEIEFKEGVFGWVSEFYVASC